MKRKYPRLEMHITNHCNLNCSACAHFSNICSEFFADIDQFKSSLSEITKKIDYELINILGGEPLMHPDLAEFLYSARKICPDKIITISTNGLLIPSLSREIWKALRKNRIFVRLSAYPPLLKNIQNYIDLIRSNYVNMCGIWDGQNFHLRKSACYIEDKKSVWKTCDAKFCHQLYLDKIYPCPFDAYGKFYNKYFNKQFYFDDGIDIYQNSAAKIIKYLENPVRNCSACTKYGRMIKWKFSECRENEWDVLQET